jgi:hypothetical protein
MSVRLDIKVIPKSRHQRLEFQGNALKIWLQAPPSDGRANDELIEILAKKLGVPGWRVEIVAGFTSRNKKVDILGVNLEEIEKILSS